MRLSSIPALSIPSMVFRFTSVPAKYTASPLLAPPLPVTPSKSPSARATHPSLSRVYPSRVYPSRVFSSRTVSHLYTCAPAALQRGPRDGSTKILRPAGGKIQTVKELFVDCFPELDQKQRNTKYNDFRSRIDHLCGLYLRPTVALAYQAKEDADKVYNKMATTFPWLTSYHNYWPVAVCLQGKLHNSAARAVERSNKKAVDIIQSVAPARSGSKGARKVKKVTLRTPN
ncbi:hypothetical protein C8F04DRAFT_1253034 [Mycena alexandri]|uniref:Uncharacterized protein n=1 Tax=Mycena alexandri TaxID=1745969 RepID=A0AAD6T9G3_9AGAR|nr:hypothetical protein C8F04DRAFT_1253034 [Mycena alexandri]